MESHRKWLVCTGLAIAGLCVAADAAQAFWCRPVFRQRTVIRGGGFAMPTGPSVRGGREFAFSGPEYYFRSSGESAFESDGEWVWRTKPRNRGRGEADLDGGSVGGGGGGGTTTPKTPASDCCADLKSRLDKVETRLGNIETKLAAIEKRLAAPADSSTLSPGQMKAVEDRVTSLLKTYTTELGKELAARDQRIVLVLEGLNQPKPDQQKIKELIDKLKPGN